MHFSLFFTPLLLLAEQTTLISAVLTPTAIVGRIDSAIDDVVNVIDDLTVTSAKLNASVRSFVIIVLRPSANDTVT